MPKTWKLPVGYDTGIKIYNCAVGKKVPLILRHANNVNWYSCGPTVYSRPHLGHAVTYMRFDILQRILGDFFRFNVATAMNITDIDDKILREAEVKNVSISEIANKSKEEFFANFQCLNVRKPLHLLEVTKNMHLVKDMIEILLKNGYAYIDETESICFNLEKAAGLYGKLQKNLSVESLKDFVLWKSARNDREPAWSTNWTNRKGRPGWHIECSALASHVFGQNIDIHAGGKDLKFPHHENEEIQCCAYYGIDQWVNYWIHSGHLYIRNSKMSKSLNNIVTIDEMIEKNFRFPQIFRLAMLMSHYRNDLNYNENFLAAAESSWRFFDHFFLKYHKYYRGKKKHYKEDSKLHDLVRSSRARIEEHFKDDFNTAKVVQLLQELVKNVNDETDSTLVQAVYDVTRATIGTFGMDYQSVRSHENKISFDYLQGFLESVQEQAKETNSAHLVELCNQIENVLADVDQDFRIVLDTFRSEVRTFALLNSHKYLLQLCDDLRNRLVQNYGIVFLDTGAKNLRGGGAGNSRLAQD